jgi:ribonucleoside-diphosphate reductase alpha chain
MAKEGSTIGGLMDSFGTAISISLQYGVPLEVLVHKFSHTRFEPNGHTTNPDIRIAKSVVDYIFRWLGLTFLASYREEQKAKAEMVANIDSKESAPTKPVANVTSTPVNGNGAETERAKYTEACFAVPNGKPVWNITDSTKEDSREHQFSRFQSDAPACDNCGSVTVRNGNCYLCHNCGNSLGCS